MNRENSIGMIHESEYMKIICIQGNVIVMITITMMMTIIIIIIIIINICMAHMNMIKWALQAL